MPFEYFLDFFIYFCLYLTHKLPYSNTFEFTFTATTLPPLQVRRPAASRIIERVQLLPNFYKMPFNEIQRRDSWPPTILHLRKTYEPDFETIDENPFSYFLTSPDEITDDDIDDFSAGIESDDEDKSEVREVSPSALQRARSPADQDVLFGFGMPLSLKDFTQQIHGNGRESRTAHRMDELSNGLGISIPDLKSSRDRKKVQFSPIRGRGRGQTRSLPLRRPHSWREPSPDLGSIKEERESEDGEEIEENTMPKEIASAPATAMIPSKAVASPKPKKRVHWAI